MATGSSITMQVRFSRRYQESGIYVSSLASKGSLIEEVMRTTMGSVWFCGGLDQENEYRGRYGQLERAFLVGCRRSAHVSDDLLLCKSLFCPYYKREIESSCQKHSAISPRSYHKCQRVWRRSRYVTNEAVLRKLTLRIR